MAIDSHYREIAEAQIRDAARYRDGLLPRTVAQSYRSVWEEAVAGAFEDHLGWSAFGYREWDLGAGEMKEEAQRVFRSYEQIFEFEMALAFQGRSYVNDLQYPTSSEVPSLTKEGMVHFVRGIEAALKAVTVARTLQDDGVTGFLLTWYKQLLDGVTEPLVDVVARVGSATGSLIFPVVAIAVIALVVLTKTGALKDVAKVIP